MDVADAGNGHNGADSRLFDLDLFKTVKLIKLADLYFAELVRGHGR